MATEPLDVIKLLLPMFTGSGKTVGTSSSTGSISPQADAAVQKMLELLMPAAAGTDTAATDAIVANILQKAAIAFAPAGVGENQAGLYNSTVRQLMMNDAMGRAVGESSAAVLAHQTDAQKTAATLTGTLATATKGTTTTDTKQTKPTIDPRISAVLAAAALGKSAWNTFGGSSLLGAATKLKDPRLTDEGVLSQSPADAESGLAGEQYATGAGGGASTAADAGAGVAGGESFDAGLAASSLESSADVASTGSSVAAADAESINAALATDATTTAIDSGALTFTNAATDEVLPAATESTLTTTTTDPEAAAAKDTAATESNNPTADATNLVNGIPGSDASLAIGSPDFNADKLMAADDAFDAYQGAEFTKVAAANTGTVTDVSAGLLDSNAAIANADSAFAIPEGVAATSAASSAFLYPLTFAISDMLGSNAEVAKNKAQVQQGIQQFGGGDAYAKHTAANLTTGGEDYVDPNSETISVNGENYGRGTLNNIFAHGLEDSLSSDVRDAYTQARAGEIDAAGGIGANSYTSSAG